MPIFIVINIDLLNQADLPEKAAGLMACAGSGVEPIKFSRSTPVPGTLRNMYIKGMVVASISEEKKNVLGMDGDTV